MQTGRPGVEERERAVFLTGKAAHDPRTLHDVPVTCARDSEGEVKAMAKKNANGEGNIRQRPDGMWEARVSLPDGKRKSVYGKTRKEVHEKLTEVTGLRNRGVPVQTDERLTVGAFLIDWQTRVRPTIRASTWRRYCQLLQRVRDTLGNVTLTRLAPEQVEALYAGLLSGEVKNSRQTKPLAPATVRQLHVILHHALDDALRKGKVSRNICEFVANVPRVPRHENQTYSFAQVRTLLQAAQGDRLEALYVLAVTTGMRQGELLALKWQNVDLDGATLHVRATVAQTAAGKYTFSEPKTARGRRRIPLQPIAVEALRRHRARQNEERIALGAAWRDQGLIFTDALGELLKGPQVLRAQFYPLLARAGLPRIRFHDLRHTTATLLLQLEKHPKMVSELLGHSTISITLDTYSHALPDMVRGAVDDLGRALAGTDSGPVGVRLGYSDASGA